MPQINVDPEELAQFAVDLRDYADTVEQERGRIRGKFKRLQDTWQDQDAAATEAELEQIHAVLEHHIENCRDLVSYLANKAHKLFELQETRR